MGSREQHAYAAFPPQQLKNGNHLAEVVRSKPGRRIYGENATYPPILAVLGLFAYPTQGVLIVSLTPCKIIILSNKRIPQ